MPPAIGHRAPQPPAAGHHNHRPPATNHHHPPPATPLAARPARGGSQPRGGSSRTKALGEVEGSLWTRDPGLPPGSPVRLRVLARDVSLAITPQSGTSIANQLPATVEAIADDAHAGLTLVRVRVGTLPLVARLTRRSAHKLGLLPGLPVWAQVKTVALLE